MYCGVVLIGFWSCGLVSIEPHLPCKAAASLTNPSLEPAASAHPPSMGTWPTVSLRTYKSMRL